MVLAEPNYEAGANNSRLFCCATATVSLCHILHGVTDVQLYRDRYPALLTLPVLKQGAGVFDSVDMGEA